MPKRRKKDNLAQFIKSILIGAGVLFLSMLVTLGFLVFVNWAVATMRELVEEMIRRQFIARIISIQERMGEMGMVEEKTAVEGMKESAPEPVKFGVRLLPSKVVKEDEENLIASSFTDLFSGVGWINQNETTFFQDRTTTAFTFPPAFEWQRASAATAAGFLEEKADGSTARCLNNFCLVQKNLKLFFVPQFNLESYQNSSYELSFPSDISSQNLVSISIGALDSRWLVGTVEQLAGRYLGRVYYFDGEKFSPVLAGNKPLFESRYSGVIGFGGDDESFLVVYGAYEGQAYLIKEGVLPDDISEFFGIRVMNDGFHPAVIKSIVDDDVVWYVYSLDKNKPKFIKLFQNGTERIRGIVDLSRFLFAPNVETALFAPETDGRKLKARITSNAGVQEFWEFLDKGFDKTKELEIVSININNYPAEIRRAKISQIDLAGEGADIDIFLSNDGEKWHKVSFGEEIVFPDKKGRRLLWRAVFKPLGGQYTSPFFDRIRIDYVVKFL